MKSAHYLVALVTALVISTKESCAQKPKVANHKPRIALSFDDGDTLDVAGYSNQNWNQRILDQLKSHQVQAGLFSMGHNKTSAKGKEILDSWSKAGHIIANHSFRHPNLNSPKVSARDMELEMLKCDSQIRAYPTYRKWFRFPYLKEGNPAKEVQDFREAMARNGYQNAHVSVDASDWYVSSRLVKALTINPKQELEPFRKYYLDHLFNRAQFYDSLAQVLGIQQMDHVLLLHHNLAAALFLGDLMEHFKDQGWDVIGIEEAYQHSFYKTEAEPEFAGESLVWAKARAKDLLKQNFRIPPEDGRYEKEKMDRLGL